MSYLPVILYFVAAFCFALKRSSEEEYLVIGDIPIFENPKMLCYEDFSEAF